MRLTLLLCCILPASAAIAADWPMGGRSADRNPVSLEKDAPTDWQIETDGSRPRNVRWTAQLGSRSIGGPVVAGGLVWVGTNNDNPLDPKVVDDCSILACFRESDGKFLYQYASARRGDMFHDWTKQSLSGSPLIEGDRLWFCNNRKEVICLDIGPLHRGTGPAREVWKYDMVKELNLTPWDLMIPGHNTHGSPAAYRDWLYVPTGNGINRDPKIKGTPDGPALICLQKDTGKLVWKVNSPGPDHRFGQYASALVTEIGGRGQVIHPQGDGWVRSFDPESGKLLWKFDPNPIGAKWDGETDEPEAKRNCVMSTPDAERPKRH